MTTANTVARTPPSQGLYEFPDPPQRKPDAMTSFNHLNVTGSAHHLLQHLGNPDTTLVAGEHYVSPEPTRNMEGLRYPDLLVAFDVNPAAYYRSNAYVISEQGKPPDFVLEIASRSTGRADIRAKRDDYAALGISEYWRFDETGRYHGARLAGDRLVDGVYVPIPIAELAADIRQGYSAALNLNLRWERGRLGWYDPATELHILTYDDQRAQVARERARYDDQRTRADRERAARRQAEARVRELEEELQRLRNS